MSAFNGRWKLTSSDSLDPIHEAIGVPEEWREKARGLTTVGETAPEEEFDIQGDKATFKLFLNGSLVKQGTTTMNKEIETSSLDGRTIKLVLEKVADDRIVRTEKGDGYEVKYDRKVDGASMVLEVTSGDVKCVRKYKKV